MLKSKQSSGLGKFIVVVLASAIIFLLIQGIFILWDKYQSYKYRRILENLQVVTGLVTDKHDYKGLGIDIEYEVEGQNYTYKPAISNQTYERYQVGDTISVTICKSEPSLALLTLNINNKEKLRRFLGEDTTNYLNTHKTK
ncbi:DUF3592 domain-containing protein [Xanthocytophaga agilis]|uniref:DUF3592 domain-containing protein n=1 Tax=Xanthocytophaga agilis TaxID=3048010 RepID=A0AAE3QWV7_9BACT|nr:DUF3592 domain-containing protein [Xanthocytophaga agilis]MDJ1499476.1 hypothetical protein [Xanthocytophaga agilis]